ncbi:DUF3995 domain-containing protein [Streptomyces sp. NPDC020403]|uniref:DUF3995 domain-containing protein n=1 Tax=unclassified Streptomyces TaxID=2593676 RepID=UPI0033EA0854
MATTTQHISYRDANSWWGMAGSYGAAAWGLAFALVHLYWLLGGRTGLPAGLSLGDNLPLLIIDVVAIPLSLVATALALALIRPWGVLIPRRLLRTTAWGTTALMVVHALPSVVDWTALAVGARTADELTDLERFATFLYEPWFLAGGVLFGLAALGTRARR